MSRLLAADFSRLWKSRDFWTCAAFMASFGAFMVLMGYYWYQPFAQKQMFEGYFWQVKQILSVKRGQKR